MDYFYACLPESAERIKYLHYRKQDTKSGTDGQTKVVFKKKLFKYEYINSCFTF